MRLDIERNRSLVCKLGLEINFQQAGVSPMRQLLLFSDMSRLTQTRALCYHVCVMTIH